MALKIVLLALLVCYASEAQSQGDDTSLPLSYNVTELQGDGATCPNDQLRQETRDNIVTDIRTQLQDTVIPQIRVNQFCPCTSGGRRIAYLDMTDPNQQCPPNWQEISTSGVRSCARTNNAGASCDSVSYPNTGGNSYSQVCGRVIGYEYCSADGFRTPDDIEFVYVDGVSVTHGSPRQHIWSFAVAFDEIDRDVGCPCIATPNIANSLVPSFVGGDYFCDTAFPLNPHLTGNCGTITTDLAVAHPLWDGGGCGPTGGCCENNNPPWFCTTLPQPTTDDIEVRLCADQHLADEEVTVGLIEIFVN